MLYVKPYFPLQYSSKAPSFWVHCDLNVRILTGSDGCLSSRLSLPVRSPSSRKRLHLKFPNAWYTGESGTVNACAWGPLGGFSLSSKSLLFKSFPPTDTTPQFLWKRKPLTFLLLFTPQFLWKRKPLTIFSKKRYPSHAYDFSVKNCLMPLLGRALLCSEL